MMRWEDLAGRTVGVWGTGVEGQATLRRLAADGIAPTVVVESGWSQELLGCEVVIKSPGISRYSYEARRLIESGVSVVGGLGLWLASQRAEGRTGRIACITGTKGKSTTTAIAGHLIEGLGHTVFLGGNIGSPPWDPAGPESARTADYYVVEVSSYQATDITEGPAVVAVTSLSQDHLQWHGDYPTYVADKLSLTTKPGVGLVLIPTGDRELEEHVGLLGDRFIRVPVEPEPWVERLGLIGAHNVRNALLARAVVVALGVPGSDEEAALERAAEGFTPLAHRLTRVATIDGVDFVDDSLSTNVLPTLAAVGAVSEGHARRRIALLVGGQDRGIDYDGLGPGLEGRDVHVFTLPDSGPHIAAAIRSTSGVPVTECAGLAEAVPSAYSWARQGDPGGGVVLLSPAAPSFGRYRDYADRAEHFERCIAELR